MELQFVVAAYQSFKSVNAFTNLLVGIGVGIIAARCMAMLLNSLTEEKKVPWASVKKHVVAIIVLLLAYGGLLSMIKGYFIGN